MRQEMFSPSIILKSLKWVDVNSSLNVEQNFPVKSSICCRSFLCWFIYLFIFTTCKNLYLLVSLGLSYLEFFKLLGVTDLKLVSNLRSFQRFFFLQIFFLPSSLGFPQYSLIDSFPGIFGSVHFSSYSSDSIVPAILSSGFENI